jgi:hypothetical protein
MILANMQTSANNVSTTMNTTNCLESQMAVLDCTAMAVVQGKGLQPGKPNSRGVDEPCRCREGGYRRVSQHKWRRREQSRLTGLLRALNFSPKAVS